MQKRSVSHICCNLSSSDFCRILSKSKVQQQDWAYKDSRKIMELSPMTTRRTFPSTDTALRLTIIIQSHQAVAVAQTYFGICMTFKRLTVTWNVSILMRLHSMHGPKAKRLSSKKSKRWGSFFLFRSCTHIFIKSWLPSVHFGCPRRRNSVALTIVRW